MHHYLLGSLLGRHRVGLLGRQEVGLVNLTV